MTTSNMHSARYTPKNVQVKHFVLKITNLQH